MAHSIIEYTGDGSTTQYALNFTLGNLKREYVQCRVNNEVDGLGDPAYRTLTWITDGLVEIQGTVPALNDPIVFTRTMPKDELIHDYSDGAAIEEENLDESNLQNLMAIHEFLDGRITNPITNDLDMGGNKIINLADGVADTDGATVKQLNDTIAAVAADLAAAEAAQAAAETAQAAAETAQANAETAETNAETAETNAETAQTAAEAAQTAAETAQAGAETAETNAETAQAAAEAAQTAAETAETNAETAETNAETAQAAAEAAQAAAETAETNAGNSATAAASSASSASTSATNASNSATAAQTAQTAAETAETNAETAETNAEAAATLAQAYANEDEDVEVEPGLYSAKHWSAKAEDFASGAANNISYDNSTSGLTATDVQAALDEIDGGLDTVGAELTTYGDIVTTDAADYATAAQGALADSALQSADIGVSVQGFNAVNGAFGGKLLHIQDQKASGTAGGTKNATTWDTRVLNTVLTNEITGASLASNVITLPAGTYYIQARTLGYRIGMNRLRLYNVDSSTEIMHGENQYAAASNMDYPTATVSGRFTLGAETDVRLDHYSAGGQTTNGLGEKMTLGDVEIYTDVMIWKVG